MKVGQEILEKAIYVPEVVPKHYDDRYSSEDWLLILVNVYGVY
jgi:hypothetical protein